MNKYIQVLLYVIIILFLVGSPAGSHNYEEEFKIFIKNNSFPPDLEHALLGYKPLSTNMVTQLTTVSDVSTRIILARNPNLTFNERQNLWNDKDENVRRALASNLRLSHDEMNMIIQDKSIIILGGLARNPAASPEILIQLFQKYKNKKMDSYLDFVMNPNCPQEIVDEIFKNKNRLKSSIDLEQHWLRLIQERKEQYIQKKIKNEPFLCSHGYPWILADIWLKIEE